MHLNFVINGRQDKAFILAEVQRQIEENSLTNYTTYVTQGVGDGTRYVRIWCDLHPSETCCFVACGGSGTVNEVASGIVGSGKEGKYLAILAYGSSNDFCKCFPDLDFKNLKLMLEGEARQMDIIQANDNYALNVINIGFSAEAAAEGNRLIEEGEPEKAYSKGIFKAIMHSRYNDIRIMVDDHLVNTRCILTADVANGKYCGGQFKCAPNAEPDDGWMEVCVFRPMLLISFLLTLGEYKRGTHLTDPFSTHRLKYCRTKHVYITSKDLVTLCIDGEIVVSSTFKLDLLEKAITIIMPKKDNTNQ